MAEHEFQPPNVRHTHAQRETMPLLKLARPPSHGLVQAVAHVNWGTRISESSISDSNISDARGA